MKLIFINIIFLACTAFCSAQKLLFEPSLKTAFEKAVRENKLVFVEYYNAECPVCKKLEPVFSDTALAKFYNEHFISYKLNTENIKKDDSLFIQKAGLEFETVPYFLFFDKTGHFVHYSGTKQDIEYLVAAGRTALDPKQRTGDLGNKYTSGDRSIKTLYAYSNLLQLYKKDSMRSIIADELFAVFPKEELGSEKSYTITKNCATGIENGFFIYWINHINELKELEKNKKTVHPVNVLGDILLKSVNSNERKKWSLAKIRAVKGMILKTEISKDPDAFFWEQESMLLVKENRLNEAMELFHTIIIKDSDNITASAYTLNYYLNILNDNASLKKVKSWIDKLSEKQMDNSSKATMMYCNIFFYKKIKDENNLKQLSRQAIDFYKANSIDTTSLNLLLADPEKK